MNNEHQKLAEIRKLAEGLMEEHGLFGWTFKFTPAVRQYGRCTHTTKTIGISKKLGLLNELSHTKNTILHEIAHALVWPGIGHGRLWKITALNIGCDWKRCYDPSTTVLTKKRWKGECPGCGRVILRHRRIRIACWKCCDGKFESKYAFVYSEA